MDLSRWLVSQSARRWNSWYCRFLVQSSSPETIVRAKKLFLVFSLPPYLEWKSSRTLVPIERRNVTSLLPTLLRDLLIRDAVNAGWRRFVLLTRWFTDRTRDACLRVAPWEIEATVDLGRHAYNEVVDQPRWGNHRSDKHPDQCVVHLLSVCRGFLWMTNEGSWPFVPCTALAASSDLVCLSEHSYRWSPHIASNHRSLVRHSASFEVEYGSEARDVDQAIEI